MHIYLASDHAGYELKEKLKSYLAELGHAIEDLGAHALDPHDDYPDFVRPCAERVSEDSGSRGIVIGGSGQGEAMVANRIPGVRAAVLYHYNEDVVRLSREHNDANILSLGARFLSEDEATRAVTLWLETSFSGDERHKRRIGKIDA